MTKLSKCLLLLPLLLATTTTYAETIGCTPITSLPFEIKRKGLYCFTGNLSTKGQGAIKIKVSNVTIDLNGWTLDGLAAGPTTKGVGIFAFRRSNITIRNGIIRGFYQAINLYEPSPYGVTSGHLIEDVRVELSTYSGIQVAGANNTIRRNHVVDTGDAIFSPTSRAFGMQIYGTGSRVIDNDIINTAGTGRDTGYGLVVGRAQSAFIENNRITEVSSQTGESFGIYISNSNNALVRSNNLIDMQNGIYYSNSDNGKNMDNLTTNVDVPFTGGIQTGIND